MVKIKFVRSKVLEWSLRGLLLGCGLLYFSEYFGLSKVEVELGKQVIQQTSRTRTRINEGEGWRDSLKSLEGTCRKVEDLYFFPQLWPKSVTERYCDFILGEDDDYYWKEGKRFLEFLDTKEGARKDLEERLYASENEVLVNISKKKGHIQERRGFYL